MRVFLLGAGFSKPAGLPLANEILEPVIQRLTSGDEDDDLNRWSKDLQQRIRYLQHRHDDVSQFQINVEEFFDFAQFDIEAMRLKQHSCPVGRNHGMTPWSDAEGMSADLQHLEDAIVDLIWERQASANLEPILRWAKTLRNDDVVATFNYDTLVEKALSYLNRAWYHGMQQEKDHALPVLKLHGSIDWLVQQRRPVIPDGYTLLFRKTNVNRTPESQPTTHTEEECDLLRVDDAQKLDNYIQTGLGRGFCRTGIAGLGRYKPLHVIPGLIYSWARAEQSLATTEQIIIIGFSMSPFDAMVRLRLAGVMLNRKEKNLRPPTVHVIGPASREIARNYEIVFDEIKFHNTPHEAFDWSIIA